LRAFPYHFDDPPALERSLEGVDVLYNTYWVRFNYGANGFSQAVENSQRLFEAAARAGVRRVVHLSVSNPDAASPLPYFRGKALVEQSLQNSGLSHAILRPTLIFGLEDILITNIAYLLRRFPFFAVPGNGQYRLQPVFVEDLAEIAVRKGSLEQDQVFDVAGPEIITFESLLRMIAGCIRRPAWLVKSPTGLALAAAQVIGWALGDITLTREEALGLMANKLVTGGPPAGVRKLSDWLSENAETVGRRYAAELARHF
jgi:NADH dehydrogenase